MGNYHESRNSDINRVQVEDEVRSSKRVTTLMGIRLPTKRWIEKHVEFGMQRDQSILDNKEVQILENEKYIEEETNW